MTKLFSNQKGKLEEKKGERAFISSIKGKGNPPTPQSKKEKWGKI